MSAIAGIIDLEGAPLDPRWITTMTSAMAARGPDGINHWHQDSAALGHCLLCTTAEAREERQPLVSDCTGAVLVMDGRLDNWRELRQELSARGAVLRDRTDAELVLRAYEAWGRNCLQHLDGDFAFVIWDAAHRRIFGARDAMGAKPFNYHWDGRRLAFASELHAIVAMPWVPQTLNHGTLSEYLSMHWLSRRETPWTAIERLPAAHWLAIDEGRLTIGRHWQPDLHDRIEYRRDDDYIEHYRHLLADAVRRTSRTHLPLSCEVSGGLDSSAVFAIAAGLQREGTLPAPSLSGFTLRFDDGSEADELGYARAVAAHVGLAVHEIEPTRQPLAWYEAWAQKYREFPGYPNGVMGMGIRDAARSSGSRTLLVGVGGDEWLSGSRDYYIEEMTRGHWRHLADAFAADVRANGLRETARWVRRSCALVALPAPIIQTIRSMRAHGNQAAGATTKWLAPQLADVFLQRADRFRSEERAPELRFPRAGQAPLHQTLSAPYNALAHEAEERLAASLGMELRKPLFTRAMVQFAFSTPERLRMRGQVCKRLHRSAIRSVLPTRVVDRTTKADFMNTFRWHAGEIRSLFATSRGVEEWIRPAEMSSALESFGSAASDGVAEWKLWALMGWAFLSRPGCGSEPFRSI